MKGATLVWFLKNKLNVHKVKKRPFALSIDEYPQILSAIRKGKRDMDLPLAIKIEEALGLEEGYYILLQLYYNIKQEKLKRERLKPDLARFRKVLFWGTDII